MNTVVETSLFRSQWPSLWTPAIHDEFAARVSEHPLLGKIIPGSRGLRKVGWGRDGKGKSGGVRIIYFLQMPDRVVLLAIYSKSATDNLTFAELKELRCVIKE